MNDYDEKTSVRNTTRWARACAAGALVAAAVIAVDLVGAPSGAQQAAPTLTPIAGVGINADQAISDDGQIVVYEESVLGSEGNVSTRVLIHDRSTATTVTVPDADAVNPAISGNGCFVTYSTFTPPEVVTTTTTSTTTTSTTSTSSTSTTTTSTTTSTTSTTSTTTTTEPKASSTTSDPTESTTSSTVSSEPDVVGDANAENPAGDNQPRALVRQTDTAAPTGVATLHAFDRCAVPLSNQSVIVADNIVATAPIGAAAVSFDGTVIAYSDGDNIVRMQGTLTGYVLDAAFDSSIVPSPDITTGPNLDMSSDGTAIVFEAGAVRSDGTTGFGVHSWTNAGTPSVTPVATNSTSPSISADGSLVAFASSSDSDSAFLGVVIQSRSNEGVVTNISIDPFGTQPDLSEDGLHVVYNTTSAGRTAPNMALTSSVGDGVPYVGVSVIDLSAAVAGASATTFAVSGPVVSAQGDAIAFDADVSAQPAGTPRVVAVRTLTATGSLDADSYDLGRGDVGDTLRAIATYTNQGPASVGFGSDAITVESPFTVAASECIGSVGPGASCAIEITTTIDSLEDIFGSITLTALNGSTATAELTALGAVATSSTDRSTTTPPNTTPRITTRNTTPNTIPRNTTRTTTRNTTRVTTQNSTIATVVEIDLPPTFEPATFEFAPTIINAGRRTASLDIVNAGGSTESVATAAFADPDAGFSVVDTTCTSLTVGARCTLNISFAPTTEGTLGTDLVVAFASGTEIRAAVTGVGAPEPTVAVIPGVATGGQVVTVQGVGFPAGSTVSLAFGELVEERDVVINDSGVFNLPLVVIPSTPAGPMTVSIEGQVDLFGDIVTEMLVTRSSRRTNPGVLGSLGARIGS